MIKTKFSLFRVAVAVATLTLCAVLIGAVRHAILTGDHMAGVGVMLIVTALPILIVGGWDITNE